MSEVESEVNSEAKRADRKSVTRTALRFLFFRASREELVALDRHHLLFGLLTTWLVGMGRYWDDPGAGIPQHLGLGSLVYVFVLSGMLWITFAPLGAKDWTYARVLTLVTLTSLPALLYAIPVERFMSISTARMVNVGFLAVVAGWRVALLVFFARRVGRLDWGSLFVGTLLPLTLIVGALSVLNLERVVFNIMAGLHDHQETANESAYIVILMLGALGAYTFVPLLLLWLVLLVRNASRKR